MNILVKRIVLVLIVLLSVPVLFQFYQPIFLGAVGILLAAVGFFLSPIILLGVLIVFVLRAWKN